MQYIEFLKLFAKYAVFSLADIRQADPAFQRRRLNEWQEKGYIRKIIKGYYIFSDLVLDEKTLFEIGNRIYGPSYISFEMALAHYGLIPESVYGITSAVTRKTSHFKTPVGEFIYHSLSPKLYFGFTYIRNGERFYKMASVEKAFLDFFYLKPELRDADDFAALRINADMFLKIANRKTMDSYLQVYSQKSLTLRVKAFWEYIKHV